MPEASMNEAVGDELPDPAVQDNLLWLQAEIIEHPANDVRQSYAKQFQQ